VYPGSIPGVASTTQLKHQRVTQNPNPIKPTEPGHSIRALFRYGRSVRLAARYATAVSGAHALYFGQEVIKVKQEGACTGVNAASLRPVRRCGGCPVARKRDIERGHIRHLCAIAPTADGPGRGKEEAYRRTCPTRGRVGQQTERRRQRG
jgi:hypothetical protein